MFRTLLETGVIEVEGRSYVSHYFESKTLRGVDSLLSIVQMPGGVPVACTSIGKPGAVNAAVLAVEILATSDEKLAARLRDYKAELAQAVAEKSEKVKREFR